MLCGPAQALLLEHQSRQTLGHTTCPGGELKPALPGPKLLIFFYRVYRKLCTFPSWVCKAFPNLVLACFHPHLYTVSCVQQTLLQNTLPTPAPPPYTQSDCIRPLFTPFRAFTHGIPSSNLPYDPFFPFRNQIECYNLSLASLP